MRTLGNNVLHSRLSASCASLNSCVCKGNYALLLPLSFSLSLLQLLRLLCALFAWHLQSGFSSARIGTRPTLPDGSWDLVRGEGGEGRVTEALARPCVWVVQCCDDCIESMLGIGFLVWLPSPAEPSPGRLSVSVANCQAVDWLIIRQVEATYMLRMPKGPQFRWQPWPSISASGETLSHCERERATKRKTKCVRERGMYVVA